MPPKPNSHSNGRHFDFTEPRVNWDIPSELLDPPFSYHWEQYPSFISRLIHDAGVPPPASAGAGPSTRSTTTALPQLLVPIEQVVAALAAAYSAGQKSNQYKFQEIDYKLEKLYDSIRTATDTREELQSIKKSCELSDQCHENLANGVIALTERVDDLTAELAVVKAKLAKSEEEKAAMRTELVVSRAEKAEVRAELNLVRQSTEALNNAMLQAQQRIALMRLRLDELEEQEADDADEEEEDNNGVEGLVAGLEGMEVDEHPEVIDP